MGWGINSNASEKEKLKAEMFPNTIGHALLIDTEWGTTEWLYGGMIHMAIDMIKEWREIESV